MDTYYIDFYSLGEICLLHKITKGMNKQTIVKLDVNYFAKRSTMFQETNLLQLFRTFSTIRIPNLYK